MVGCSRGCSRGAFSSGLLDGGAHAPLSTWLLLLLRCLRGATACRQAFLGCCCSGPAGCCHWPGSHWRGAARGAVATFGQLLQALGEVLNLSSILRCLLPQPSALLLCCCLLAS